MGSYPTISPLPLGRVNGLRGGIFSVPLSLGLRPVGVTHRRDPRSPDFPPARQRERPPCLQRPIFNELFPIVYPPATRPSSTGTKPGDFTAAWPPGRRLGVAFGNIHAEIAERRTWRDHGPGVRHDNGLGRPARSYPDSQSVLRPEARMNDREERNGLIRSDVDQPDLDTTMFLRVVVKCYLESLVFLRVVAKSDLDASHRARRSFVQCKPLLLVAYIDSADLQSSECLSKAETSYLCAGRLARCVENQRRLKREGRRGP